ncbi:MAG: SGNH/GDSL hydrolase family protein [Kiritimatiellae bacterium]|nr:SGNH/GDSL hydrolase family protein [Kiritimatiellia bacterium]MDD5522384.1 SGNH/GDSL hydrolase family protein [Kiritimatiellia bacterium]
MKLKIFSAFGIIGLVIAIASGAEETDKRLHSGGSAWGVQKADIKDPKLPRILLIGDSILNGYRGTVAKELDGKANVDAWVNPYHQASGGLHEKLKGVLSEGPYTLIHFNMGLHGWQKGRIPEGQFDPLMRKYIKTLRDNANGAILIWASSTPVTVKGKPGELNPEINPTIIEHNALAAKIMQDEKIPINDLYQLVVDKRHLAAGDQFHWKKEAYILMGKQIAEMIRKELEAK